MALMQIPITKAKTTVQIDTDTDLSDERVYAEIIWLGTKELLNRGTSKITKNSTKDEAELKSLALKKAEEQLVLVREGKIRFVSEVKTKKASGAVMTEAMRLARQLVKDAMKEEGIKISHVKASEITAAAKEVLDDPEQGPPILAQAEKNIAEREAAAAGKPKLSAIVKAIKTDPAKVAKAVAEAAERKAAVSAKQAGMTKQRAGKGAPPKGKPQQPQQVPAQG